MLRRMAMVLFIFMFSLVALAEGATDAPVAQSTPEPDIPASRIADDGQVRVLLRSLNSPTMLHLTLSGIYTLEGEHPAQFQRDSMVTLLQSDGRIWMGAGGLWMDIGESARFVRHTDGTQLVSGAVIRETGRDNLYAGDLSVSIEGNGLRCVVALDVEDYLCGVIAYEMGDNWPIDALKAQAVAARTYVLQHKANAQNMDYDVVDTTADQVFRGLDTSLTNVLAAVTQTQAVVGTTHGAYANCYYTASNGGQVARPKDVWQDAEKCDYIDVKDDPYDLANPLSVVYRADFLSDASDQTELMGLLLDALSEALDAPYYMDEITAVEPVRPVPEETRRYTAVRFDVRCRVRKESAPQATAGADDAILALDAPEPEYEEKIVPVEIEVFGGLKEALGLAINTGDYELITALKTEQGFALEARRFGHGVGMSQRGAQRMAGVEHFGWVDILQFYYPGMALEREQYRRPETKPQPTLPAGADTGVPAPTPSPAPLPELGAGEYIATVHVEDGVTLLNVRQMPTTQSTVLDRFSNGRQVIVTSEADENGWVSIRTAELSGYVKAEYLIAEGQGEDD